MQSDARLVLTDDGLGVVTVESHWIEFDAKAYPRNRRKALCGDIVDADSFSTEPSCQECQRKQLALE